MRCDACREAISARIDGEDDGTGDGPFADGSIGAGQIDAHLTECESCRDFALTADALHRRVRVRGADPVPDRTAELLTLTAPLAPRADRLPAAATTRQPWARYGLLWVALVQLVLAVPALFLGADHGASLHVAHEIGAWDAALAIAMLTVAFQPRRAAGLLPFVGSLTVVLLLTAVIDVVGGRTPVVGETGHLLTLAGVLLLWAVARSRPDPRPLIRVTRRPAA